MRLTIISLVLIVLCCHSEAQRVQPDPKALQGTYIIRNKHSGLVFDIPNGDTANGVGLQQYHLHYGKSQRFNIYKGPFNTELNKDTFYVINVASQKALEIPNGQTGDGVQVRQSTLTMANNQLWVTYLMESPGWKQIMNVASRKVLDIPDFLTTDGIHVQQFSKKESPENIDNQLFEQVPYTP